MANAVSNTSKPQKTLIPEASPSHANPSSKPYINHFLYKASLVTILLVLLPFFPSLAPEFINQTLHARSWELLQLIFVGIAVSYGLFSTKNGDVDDTDKDHHHSSKLDTAQSYVSKLLQVSSSVFEDEPESTRSSVIDDNKVQTWNSQYYREEPVVVVTKNTPSVVSKENGFSVGRSQKPLLLPVRSLKQRVLDEPNEELGPAREDVDSVNRSSSRRFSSSSSFGSKKARSGDIVERVDLEKENVVLRSPIPWRSRSGRMIGIKKENGDDDDDDCVLSPSLDDRQELRSRSFRSSSSSPNLSPKNLSPSSSIKLGAFSSESQAKSGEDLSRKRSLNLSSRLPPPPPPPLPPFLRKWNSSVTNSKVNNSSEKVLRRSVRSVPKEEIAEIEREEDSPTRMNMRQGRVQSDGSELRFKSVRTFRSSSAMEEKKATPKYETNKFVVAEKVVMGSSDEEWNGESEDDDDEQEEEDYLEKSPQAGIQDDHSSHNSNNTDDSVVVNDDGDDGGGGGGGPDVDKKADEFIAKFREQIRQQRIESIRRSTAQRRTTSTLR